MSGVPAYFLCYVVCVVHSFHGDYTHETGANLSVPMSKCLCTSLF